MWNCQFFTRNRTYDWKAKASQVRTLKLSTIKLYKYFLWFTFLNRIRENSISEKGSNSESQNLIELTRSGCKTSPFPEQWTKKKQMRKMRKPSTDRLGDDKVTLKENEISAFRNASWYLTMLSLHQNQCFTKTITWMILRKVHSEH